MNIVILGLSVTSSWGNGHATTYRSLIRGLTSRGHSVVFLERNEPWYAENRDLPQLPVGRAQLYEGLPDLKRRFTRCVRQADVVIVGSYVPEGCAVGGWVTRIAQGMTAFYDIDTPITLSKLDRGDTEYISPALLRRYDLYLSFTGGPMLDTLERRYAARAARTLYCSVDLSSYYPENQPDQWDLGYLGTYSQDRQPALESLLIAPAKTWRRGRFVVAGPMYPKRLKWPDNVKRVEHLAPGLHRQFYNSQRYTLNITRADMVAAGYSPSVRLFEAAACGAPIISDYWKGLETLFKPGKEILIANSASQALSYLLEISESERLRIARQARARVLTTHTSEHRAMELENHVASISSSTTASGGTCVSDRCDARKAIGLR